MKRTVRVLVSLALAAALLGALWAWGELSWSELVAIWRRLPLGALALAVCVHAGIYLVRAWRFRILIPPDEGYGPARRPSYASVLAASAAHNLAAYVLPAKTGEAALVVYLRAVGGVPSAEGAALLVVSRLVDLATLAGSLGAATLVIAAGGGGPSWFAPLGWAALLAAALFGLASARGHLLVDGASALLRALRVERTPLGARALGLAATLSDSFRRAGAEGRLARATLASLPMWLGVFLFYALLARGLGLPAEVDLARAAFGSGLAVLTNLLPVNGFAGFGTQEAGWVLGFGALGIEHELAFATGLGVHLVQLADTCLFGLLGHLAMGALGRATRRAPST